MTPWMLLTGLVAAVNLAALIVIRGRWGRMVGLLLPASLLGTAAGDAIGAATGLEMLRLGDFHVLAASVGAQVAMLVVLLAVTLVPSDAERQNR